MENFEIIEMRKITIISKHHYKNLFCNKQKEMFTKTGSKIRVFLSNLGRCIYTSNENSPISQSEVTKIFNFVLKNWLQLNNYSSTQSRKKHKIWNYLNFRKILMCVRQNLIAIKSKLATDF
jgi:hypothetical protein